MLFLLHLSLVIDFILKIYTNNSYYFYYIIFIPDANFYILLDPRTVCETKRTALLLHSLIGITGDKKLSCAVDIWVYVLQ